MSDEKTSKELGMDTLDLAMRMADAVGGERFSSMGPASMVIAIISAKCLGVGRDDFIKIASAQWDDCPNVDFTSVKTLLLHMQEAGDVH